MDFLTDLISTESYLQATIVLGFTSLILYFFMESFLLRKEAIDRSIFVRFMPFEILFRFRDYTKRHNHYILHILYFIELIVLASFALLQIPKVVMFLDFSSIVVRVFAFPFGIIFVLLGYTIYLQYKDKYY